MVCGFISFYEKGSAIKEHNDNNSNSTYIYRTIATLASASAYSNLLSSLADNIGGANVVTSVYLFAERRISALHHRPSRTRLPSHLCASWTW